jgi:hypothetical protein
LFLQEQMAAALTANAPKPVDMKVKTLPLAAASEQGQWSPYTMNGGTSMAVAGKDFCVVAGDTRMSKGYSISCRHVPKAHTLYVHPCLFTKLISLFFFTQDIEVCDQLGWHAGGGGYTA